jgi:putrescine transport system substrate-binding protein
VSDQVGYANPNPASGALMDQEIRNDEAVYPSKEVQARLYVNSELPPKIQRVMTRSWTKIKSGK